MAVDLFFRTEDLRPDEVLTYFVETPADRAAVDALKGRSAVILKGSRGVGKSFLLRVAEAELTRDFPHELNLPVYVTFARAMLIKGGTPERFLAWMIAKICNRIVRAATYQGVDLPGGVALSTLLGGAPTQPSRMERIETLYEEAWRQGGDIADADLPGPEVLKDAIQDLCETAGLRRVTLFVDEAAHVFIPEQQRQFFTLMRDLRSPYLSVKAAVYPGVTAYGDSFQPTHDAIMISVDRNVTERDYATAMRELVLKQEPSLDRSVRQYGEAFDALTYAATGNPRILLKTVARNSPFNSRSVTATLREYYREEIWQEHSSLADRYAGHRDLIDWGRRFIESQVLQDIYKRNLGRTDKSAYLWIHRDAPAAVREALRLLCYSGILQEGDSGIRATRSEVGTRYMVNVGCQIALDADPIAFCTSLRQGLSLKRMMEYGANHAAYSPIAHVDVEAIATNDNAALEARMLTSSDVLDVTGWQREKLRELGLTTIGAVLKADDEHFMKAHYVGRVRARQMHNAAVAAVLEYLSG